MADAKISELNAASAITTDDLLVIVDDPGGSEQTKKITVANFFQTIPNKVAWTAIASVPTAANNTAAASAGIAVGGIYRTNADPSVLCMRSA